MTEARNRSRRVRRAKTSTLSAPRSPRQSAQEASARAILDSWIALDRAHGALLASGKTLDDVAAEHGINAPDLKALVEGDGNLYVSALGAVLDSLGFRLSLEACPKSQDKPEVGAEMTVIDHGRAFFYHADEDALSTQPYKVFLDLKAPKGTEWIGAKSDNPRPPLNPSVKHDSPYQFNIEMSQ